MQSQAFFVRMGAVLGGLGVVLGAFGAHGLKDRVTPEMLGVFEVGVRYQMYHAIAMLALAAGASGFWRSPWAARACWCWAFGVAVFSGSLYFLAFTGIGWLGAITPFGGVALIAGWALAVASASALSAVRGEA